MLDSDGTFLTIKSFKEIISKIGENLTIYDDEEIEEKIDTAVKEFENIILNTELDSK